MTVGNDAKGHIYICLGLYGTPIVAITSVVLSESIVVIERPYFLSTLVPKNVCARTIDVRSYNLLIS